MSFYDNVGIDTILANLNTNGSPLCVEAAKRIGEHLDVIKKNFNDRALIMSAMSFAATKHRVQFRKNELNEPYINHPISLANLLCNELSEPVSVNVVVAAILHDVIEDSKTKPDEIRALFGDEVLSIVNEVSDDKKLPVKERKRLQITTASEKTYEAKLVKLADKICNLRDTAITPPVDWPKDRVLEYFDWSKAVVDQLRGTHAELEVLFDKAFEQRAKYA